MLVSDFFLLFFSFFCSILMSSRSLKGNRFSLIALFKFSAPALYPIEHGISKLTKETDCNAIVLTRILCEMSGLIKKRNGILTVTKKVSSIMNTNQLLPLIFSTFTDKFSWAFFDGYPNDDIGQFGWWYSFALISQYGDISRNSEYYAEKYFQAYPHLLTLKSYDGSIHANYSCYSIRTFDRFLEYFGFTETTEKKDARHLC